MTITSVISFDFDFIIRAGKEPSFKANIAFIHQQESEEWYDEYKLVEKATWKETSRLLFTYSFYSYFVPALAVNQRRAIHTPLFLFLLLCMGEQFK